MISLQLLLVAAVIGAWLYVLVSDPLRSVPGPLLARFTRFWELAQVRTSRFEEINSELHAEYGILFSLLMLLHSTNLSRTSRPSCQIGARTIFDQRCDRSQNYLWPRLQVQQEYILLPVWQFHLDQFGPVQRTQFASTWPNAPSGRFSLLNDEFDIVRRVR